ncbi:hypothetical protein KPL70_024513 [Citrus sinensis]|nr:hypothetical protein KPL70_024513 [Citrus sinensis]
MLPREGAQCLQNKSKARGDIKPSSHIPGSTGNEPKDDGPANNPQTGAEKFQVPNASPTIASASSDIYNAAVLDASEQLKAQMEPVASEHYFNSFAENDVSIKSTNYDTDCVMDYSNEFTTHEIFKSREAMIQWTHNVGKKNCIMVVIKRSEVSRGGRLTAEEASILVDMSKNMVRPKDILVTLKKKDPFNVSTMKSIYNARQRYKVIEMAGRSQMQQLLMAVTQKQKVELSFQPKFELIANRFNESSIEIQLDILKKLKEIANHGCTFLLDPEVKTRTRGRPSIKVDTFTRRDPSTFEISLSGQESCSLNVKSNSVTIAKSKAEVKRRGRPTTKVNKSTPVKSITFIDEFPVGLQSYIHHIKDVVADVQCLTFLPLRSEPVHILSRRNIALGYVFGNHFVENKIKMGRGKLTMQLIEKEKARMITYQKRKRGLKKKAEEFSTLCGVPTCMIIYGPRLNNRPVDVEIWPKDEKDFMQVVNLYKDKAYSSVRGVKSLSLFDFFADRKRKVDENIAKTRKANYESLFSTDDWDEMINRFSIDQLKQMLVVFDEYIDVATRKLTIMRGQQQSCIAAADHHRDQALQMIPYNYDLNPVDNPMMMLMMNGGDQMGSSMYNSMQYARCFDPMMGAMINNRLMMMNNPRADVGIFGTTILQPLQHYEQQLPLLPSIYSSQMHGF